MKKVTIQACSLWAGTGLLTGLFVSAAVWSHTPPGSSPTTSITIWTPCFSVYTGSGLIWYTISLLSYHN